MLNESTKFDFSLFTCRSASFALQFGDFELRTFEDWIVQIRATSDKNGVQMHDPIVGFVCQMPPLNNNPRWFLSSVIKACVCSLYANT